MKKKKKVGRIRMAETTIGKQSLKEASSRSKQEDVKKRHQNHRMWGRKVRKYNSFFILMMCWSLYDYQAKASRYKTGLTHLKNRATQIKTEHYIHKN